MDELTAAEPFGLHAAAEPAEGAAHALAAPLARAWPEIAAALRACGIEPAPLTA